MDSRNWINLLFLTNYIIIDISIQITKMDTGVFDVQHILGEKQFHFAIFLVIFVSLLTFVEFFVIKWKPGGMLQTDNIGKVSERRMKADITMIESNGAGGDAGVSIRNLKPKLVNINTADTRELIRLKGIGPVLADRIVEYRETHGHFKSIEALENVKGVGPKTLAQFRHLIEIK